MKNKRDTMKDLTLKLLISKHRGRLHWYALYLISGLMFWLPSTVRHSIQGDQFGNVPDDRLSVTVLPVICAVLALGALVIWRPAGSSRYPIVLLMLLGIWMLGPLCIMIGNTSSGGGFTVPGTGWVVLLGAVTVWPVTLLFSIMGGYVYALAFVTVLFILLVFVDLSEWIKGVH